MKATYNMLGSAQIDENRNLVISECKKNEEIIGFTLAQQLMVSEGKKSIGVFLKNTIHIPNISGLYELRDALNNAIDKIENE